MSDKEAVIFDLELQIEWIEVHKPQGWYAMTDAIQRAVKMLLKLGNEIE